MIVRSIIALAIGLATSLAGAEVTVQEFSWSKLRDEERLVVGQVVPADSTTPFETLVVENTVSSPATFTVLVIENPGITSSNYAVRGRIAYEGVEEKMLFLEGEEWKLQAVEGSGDVEMWSCFPDGTRDSSRTIGNSEALQYREGTSDWQEFEVRSRLGRKRKRPDRLIINVVLPGKGKFRLGPLRLIEYGERDVPRWWSDRQGGLIGGIAGSVLGCLGGLIGLLCSRGTGRRFVLAAMNSMIVLGAAFAGVGIVALVLSQPYGVVYPLLLVGVLMLAIYGGLLGVVRRRYEERELWKITARDV